MPALWEEAAPTQLPFSTSLLAKRCVREVLELLRSIEVRVTVGIPASYRQGLRDCRLGNER